MPKPSPVTVRPVSNRRERKLFLNFPWDHYRGDPNWVPPLRGNQKELVNYKRHPFYDNARITTFLAWRDGQVCGRIAAITDHAHNRYYKENRGMFGFFESVNDRQVSDALFDACRKCFSGQGIQDMRGPLNPSMNYECGLLIDGFDTPPTFMMTYNHDYYPQLIEGYGFQKSQDMLAFYGHVDMLATLDEKLKFVAEEALSRFDLKMRGIERKRFLEDVRTFLDIYNKSLPGQWGFVPFSDTELLHVAGGLKQLIIPELTSIAEDETGPVGVVFGLLDYNPLIRQIDGRLFPFGFLRLLRGRRKIKRVRLVSTNVLPKYQMWGLGLVLMARIIPPAIGYGIEEAEFSWVLESNKLSRGTLERGGAELIKKYRIFDYHWD
jgi:GNAT superfamily N-acetyltransferase